MDTVEEGRLRAEQLGVPELIALYRKLERANLGRTVSTAIEKLMREVVACERCPRLRNYCRAIAEEKRRAYRDWDYWGKPVPSFGDPNARVLVVGLAPGAHGANRTGRDVHGRSIR